MNALFADRINDVPRSFIREILKDALAPGTISFAGGLPNRDLFPADEIQQATDKVFRLKGKDIFQYSQSEGLPALREFISQRYRSKGLDIPVANILITSGSQQGLDLLGKTLINENDALGIEEPGYLGAIQAFSIYRPRFVPLPVDESGMQTAVLAEALARDKPKLIYTVPNFQNPSGITYPEANRHAVADLIRPTKTILIEDDPYGDLRFTGEHLTSFKQLIPEHTVMLGSFSKVVVPGFRLGWIVAPDALMQKLIIAKQASDLHSSSFLQEIMLQYLTDNDLDEHIRKITAVYGHQKAIMASAIEQYFPASVAMTHPEGGMFLWATLPGELSAMDLFNEAVKDRVVFVPGDPFYVRPGRIRTLRLNYSCVTPELIESGIERLAVAIRTLLAGQPG
jgi:2-aminoadipate transaminase